MLLTCVLKELDYGDDYVIDEDNQNAGDDGIIIIIIIMCYKFSYFSITCAIFIHNY